jgi:hypothetical protein
MRTVWRRPEPVAKPNLRINRPGARPATDSGSFFELTADPLRSRLGGSDPSPDESSPAILDELGELRFNAMN